MKRPPSRFRCVRDLSDVSRGMSDRLMHEPLPPRPTERQGAEGLHGVVLDVVERRSNGQEGKLGYRARLMSQPQIEYGGKRTEVSSTYFRILSGTVQQVK